MKNGVRFSLCGRPALAHHSGALWLPGLKLLAVADLHFEKGAALTRRGGGVAPPYDTRATLQKLGHAIETFRPATVVSLGDAFHDDRAAKALPREERDMLAQLANGRRWVWIAGNHDPSPHRLTAGETRIEYALGGFTFRHHPRPSPADGELAGHLHPKLRARGGGGRCFATDGRRVVLPAFGAYAGGLDVDDPAIASLFPNGFNALVIGRSGVFCLRGDRAGRRPAQTGDKDERTAARAASAAL